MKWWKQQNAQLDPSFSSCLPRHIFVITRERIQWLDYLSYKRLKPPSTFVSDSEADESNRREAPSWGLALFRDVRGHQQRRRGIDPGVNGKLHPFYVNHCMDMVWWRMSATEAHAFAFLCVRCSIFYYETQYVKMIVQKWEVLMLGPITPVQQSRRTTLSMHILCRFCVEFSRPCSKQTWLSVCGCLNTVHVYALSACSQDV